MCPVRELELGDRPRNWGGSPDEGEPSSGDDGDRVVAESTASSAPAQVGATVPNCLEPERYKVRIPLDPITRSGRIRSSFRRSDQDSERSDEQRGGSGGGVGLGLGFQTFLAADGGAAEREHVSVVHEPVADRVGDSRLAERLVPTFRRQL